MKPVLKALQQLKALEQQMDEISILLVQSELRREKLLARVLAQMQSINEDVQIHLRSATTKRRRSKTNDTANKRHGFGPNIFGHHNHEYC